MSALALTDAETLEIFIEGYALDKLEALTSESVREVWRRVCYIPAFETSRKDISFRDLRMLKSFGHALELAYYSKANWSLLWPASLFLIAKYKLLTDDKKLLAASIPARPNPERTV